MQSVALSGCLEGLLPLRQNRQTRVSALIRSSDVARGFRLAALHRRGLYRVEPGSAGDLRWENSTGSPRVVPAREMATGRSITWPRSAPQALENALRSNSSVFSLPCFCAALASSPFLFSASFFVQSAPISIRLLSLSLSLSQYFHYQSDIVPAATLLPL